jgi:hypothetical protein
MNLNMGSIFNFCIETWKPSSEQSELRNQITMQVQKSRLFNDHIEAGWTYLKPLKFLSIALVESGLDWNEINKRKIHTQWK